MCVQTVSTQVLYLIYIFNVFLDWHWFYEWLWKINIKTKFTNSGIYCIPIVTIVNNIMHYTACHQGIVKLLDDILYIKIATYVLYSIRKLHSRNDKGVGMAHEIISASVFPDDNGAVWVHKNQTQTHFQIDLKCSQKVVTKFLKSYI